MPIYDITRTLTPEIAVWPGDTAFAQRWTQRIADGAQANVSTLTLSLHTGTHVDAHYHYMDEGVRLSEMELDIHIGPARVVALDVRGEISAECIAGLDLAGVQRLLVKTHASARPDHHWEPDFPYFSVAAVELLGRRGVRLVGTDAPSVDRFDAPILQAHHAFYRANVAILENVLLSDVPPGDYELIALPLKLPYDGSPVRAVLRTLD